VPNGFVAENLILSDLPIFAAIAKHVGDLRGAWRGVGPRMSGTRPCPADKAIKLLDAGRTTVGRSRFPWSRGGNTGDRGQAMVQAIAYAAFKVVTLNCLWFITDTFDGG